MRFQPAARCFAIAQQLRGPWNRLFSIPSPSSAAAAAAFTMTAHDPNPNANNSLPPQPPSPKASRGTTLAALPKSWHFTSSLPTDEQFPTPADSHKAPREDLGPRQVRNALFTWVRPETQQDPELLAVSPAAMRDLGLAPSEAETDEFKQTVVGNKIHGWDAETLSGPGYPWAQCYGGFQFGDWAGQLGDGRAISLFEATNPQTGKRYEVQLKGAGLTPYSRFADGKAVLRSSIREFVVSEALNALGIPTTRALALSLLPHSKVRRERLEPGAIVVRYAESWLRFGNFDILRARGDRVLTRRLATYLAEDVFGGWETLPGRLDDPSDPAKSSEPSRNIPRDTIQGPPDAQENRFARLYREVARRNALIVAKWQIYGFMNGVLNTDNTSLFGLSMDYGPFAFMDNFDPKYTPNHDDYLLRYSYRNQPTIIWWNLVRLGEALAELIGSGVNVDNEEFISTAPTEETAPTLAALAEKIINQVGEEFKHVFLTEYKRLFGLRLGFKTAQDTDFDTFYSPLLDILDDLSLDFHLFFRRLSSLPLSDISTPEARLNRAAIFFSPDNNTNTYTAREDTTPNTTPAATASTAPTTDTSNATAATEPNRQRIADWLATWRDRILQDWIGNDADGARIAAMKAVNPSFIPRSWILDEVIRRVEHEDDRDVLRRVTHLALHPFEDSWSGKEFDGTGETYKGDEGEEARWIGDVPKDERAMQCSCSS